MTRPVFGGFGLAVALLTLLALAGVGSDRRPAPPFPTPPPAVAGDPLFATQPEIERALLTAADLPAPSTTGPVRRPVREVGCRTLFEGLGGLPGTTTTRTSAILSQAVAVLPADSADTHAALRRSTSRCPRFTASLDDGTQVVVEMAPAVAVDNSFTVRLSVAGPRGRMGGYLAVGRAGSVVSVIRQLGPESAVGAGEMAVILDRALAKLLPVPVPR